MQVAKEHPFTSSGITSSYPFIPLIFETLRNTNIRCNLVSRYHRSMNCGTRCGFFASVPILPQWLKSKTRSHRRLIKRQVSIPSFSHGYGQVYQRRGYIQTVVYHAPCRNMSCKGSQRGYVHTLRKGVEGSWNPPLHVQIQLPSLTDSGPDRHFFFLLFK